MQKPFHDLTPFELYEILQARLAVFAVEQRCCYQDADGYDEKAVHIVIPFDGKLGAYCRVILPGIKYAEWSIGRVLTAQHARGKGLGHTLMKTAMGVIVQHGGGACRLSAQAHLQKFYESHGFVHTGKAYMEDNIPHIEMLCAK